MSILLDCCDVILRETLSLGITMEMITSSNLAMLTGIVGAITGISGSIMGYIAFRRSNIHKLSDRRVELCKLRNSTETACSELLELMSKALTSRLWTLNNHGALNSSTHQIYAEDHSVDLAKADDLSSKVPSEDTFYTPMKLLELEREIVKLDRIKVEIDSLNGKYQESISEDRNLNRKMD